MADTKSNIKDLFETDEKTPGPVDHKPTKKNAGKKTSTLPQTMKKISIGTALVAAGLGAGHITGKIVDFYSSRSALIQEKSASLPPFNPTELKTVYGKDKDLLTADLTHNETIKKISPKLSASLDAWIFRTVMENLNNPELSLGRVLNNSQNQNADAIEKNMQLFDPRTPDMRSMPEMYGRIHVKNEQHLAGALRLRYAALTSLLNGQSKEGAREFLQTFKACCFEPDVLSAMRQDIIQNPDQAKKTSLDILEQTKENILKGMEAQPALYAATRTATGLDENPNATPPMHALYGYAMTSGALSHKKIPQIQALEKTIEQQAKTDWSKVNWSKNIFGALFYGAIGYALYGMFKKEK